MSLFLSKFLPLMLYPLGLAFILILTALLLNRRPRWQRVFLILALVVLWLGSSRWVAMGLTRSLEWRYFPPQRIPKTEVVVVLGGGTEPQQFPRPLVEVNGAGDRVLYAVWLYQQGTAQNILLSGGRIDWLSNESTPAQEMADLLEMMGVPPEALWLDTDSRNTYENAVNSRALLEPKGIKKISLVTSASHMPRAVKLFEAQGFEVTPLPTDYLVTQSNWRQLTGGSLQSQIINLIPNASNLALTSRILKEYLGMFYFVITGWQ